MRRDHADYATDGTRLGMHNDWTTRQETVIDGANLPEAEASVLFDLRDEQSYLVHMGDEEDVGRPLTQRSEEIAQGISFQLGKVANGFADGITHGTLMPRHAARSQETLKQRQHHIVTLRGSIYVTSASGYFRFWITEAAPGIEWLEDDRVQELDDRVSIRFRADVPVNCSDVV